MWQGDTLLSEQTAQEHRTYLYEPGTFKPLALIVGEGEAQAVPYFYHLDQIGTPMALNNGDGSVVWSADFCAYGQLATQHVEEVKNPLRFQGQYFDDESGLHYNRHRYYCPKTGRFISPDPIGLAGGLNSYQYVVNPTGFVDPLGLVQGRENCPGNGRNYVYRALSPEQELQLQTGQDILPKNPNANYSVQEHIDDGRLETQFLSTTKEKSTAEFYAKPAPRFGKNSWSKIIRIDLDKLNKNDFFRCVNRDRPSN